MPSQGPNSPASGTDGAGGTLGVPTWNAAGNITAQDGIYATVNANNGEQSLTSDFLHATQFGFSVLGSINGITVVWRAKSSANNFQDSSVRLVKGGTSYGNDKATYTFFTAVDADYSYGGTADLWGGTWTKADINATNFGARLQVQAGTNNTATCSVDSVKITITYTPPAGNFAIIFGSMFLPWWKTYFRKWFQRQQTREVVFG